MKKLIKANIKYVIVPVIIGALGIGATLLSWQVAGVIGLIVGILVTINNKRLVDKAAEKVNL